LASQLESYLDQTHPPDEVVVCDDCSQDETVSTLNEFARRAPFPVRVFVNEQNLGSIKNFEKAISLCSGDIIFLSDQDDVWSPNKIEMMAGEFDKDHEVGMVFSDAELVDESLQPLGSNQTEFIGLVFGQKEVIKQGNLYSILLNGNVVTGATLAFRARYNNTIIPIPHDIPDMIHDGWIAIIISMTAKCVFLNQPLVKYRQHAGQQLSMDPRKYAKYMFKLPRINVMKRLEERHETKKQYVEAIKSHVTARIDTPDHIMNAVNAQIDYYRIYAQHYRHRKSLLLATPIMRLWPIVKELLSGRYHRCSKGVLSAARDVVADPALEVEYYEFIDKRKTLT
jgi:glycosyltransferase involved in cell wall biosynthesis